MKAVFLFLVLVACAVSGTADILVTAEAGQQVDITVTADGTQPFGYEWRKGGIGGVKVGTDSAVLSLVNVKANDADAYICLISNAKGSVNTPNVILTVSNPLPVPVVVAPTNGRATVKITNPPPRP